MLSTTFAAPKTRLVFIDPTLETWELLAAGVRRGIEIVVFNPVRDALEQIHNALEQRPQTEEIHVVSHGAPGTLFLGETTVNEKTLVKKQHLLKHWAGLDVLLYGCEVGAGNIGQHFIERLGQLSKGSISAAKTLVGNAEFGGRWELFRADGKATEGLAFSRKSMESYAGVLVSFAARTIATVGTGPGEMAIADLNGDGNPDLAVTNYNSDNVSILLGNGDGTFGAATNIAAGNGPQSVAVGTFDAGSTLDLAIPRFNGGVSILLGNGDGTFGASSTLGAGTQPYSVAVGTFDAGSTLDLAIANRASRNASILLGNGDGTFGGASNFGAQIQPSSVVVGNFDGGSTSDIAVTNRLSGSVSILLGNGDGTFGTATNLSVGGFPQSVATGDFNGDNNLDLVTANQTGSVSILLGNGEGTFSAANNLEQEALHPLWQRQIWIGMGTWT
ncbi:MAG: DUF4347 domain-containing protein [Cyanobacteria bacterium P01_F01_bin.153]